MINNDFFYLKEIINEQNLFSATEACSRNIQHDLSAIKESLVNACDTAQSLENLHHNLTQAGEVIGQRVQNWPDHLEERVNKIFEFQIQLLEMTQPKQERKRKFEKLDENTNEVIEIKEPEKEKDIKAQENDRVGIVVTEEMRTHLRKVLPQLLQDKKTDNQGVVVFPGRNIVFQLKQYPDLFFKVIGKENNLQATKELLGNILRVQKVCFEERLDCLVIPETIQEELEIDGKLYAVIVQKKLAVLTEEKDLVQHSLTGHKYYEIHAKTLEKAIQQLAQLVIKVGLADLQGNNIPVLKGARTIGLPDLEVLDNMQSGLFGYLGLFGPQRLQAPGILQCAMNKEMVEVIFKEIESANVQDKLEGIDLERAKKNWIDEVELNSKIRDFHQKKGISQHNQTQKIVVDVKTLGLRLDEKAEENCGIISITYTLHQTAQKIIDRVNHILEEKKAYYLSLRQARTVELDMKNSDMRVPFDRNPYIWNVDKESNYRWPDRVLRALQNNGHIAHFVYLAKEGRYRVYA